MGLFNFGKKKKKDEKAEATPKEQKQEAVVKQPEKPKDPKTNAEPAPEPQSVTQLQNDQLLVLWSAYGNEPTDDSMSNFLGELIQNTKFIALLFSDDTMPLDDDGYPMAPTDQEWQFPLLTGNDNKNFQPVFTDWVSVNELFTQWNKSGNGEAVQKTRAIVLTFDQLQQLVRANKAVDGIAINPFSENINFSRDSIADLQRQVEEREKAEAAAAEKEMKGQGGMQAGEAMAKQMQLLAKQGKLEVLSAENAAVPAGLIDDLTKVLSADKRVTRAWFCVLRVEDAGNFFLLVEMKETDEKKQQAFFERLAATAHKKLMAAKQGDLAVARYTDEMRETLGSDQTPFYTKK